MQGERGGEGFWIKHFKRSDSWPLQLAFKKPCMLSVSRVPLCIWHHIGPGNEAALSGAGVYHVSHAASQAPVEFDSLVSRM